MKEILDIVIILQLQVNLQLKMVQEFQNTVQKRGNNDSFVLICSFPMDWVRFVRLNSIGLEIELILSSVFVSFDCRNQSNSIHGLSLIEFD